MSWPNHKEDFRARCAEAARRLSSNPTIAAKRDAAIQKYWVERRRTLKRAARLAARLAAPKPGRVKCPPWVPEDLRFEFFERAKLYGEEGASQHIRNLKREMERPYV